LEKTMMLERNEAQKAHNEVLPRNDAYYEGDQARHDNET